ncbi:pectinesterase inhibitor 12-like [Raphanus sativus]|uniref:Pectinesterase inhibitor 12-like n=1 Tax=Raphanus sativus TaxID=3726 RepID=A0A6J0JS50_RAPSA|nr:pectinesterase inhibitor 12-like [Raphanus sativus]
MFASEKILNKMKFFIYLVGFFVLLNGITADKVADSVIQDSCKKITSLYDFCVASIKENPESQKVKNIDDLIIVALKNAMSNMTHVKGIVDKILKDRKYKSKAIIKPLRNCIKYYSEGTDLLAKVLENAKLRNYNKVLGSITDAVDVPLHCEYGFEGKNELKSPVKKENRVLTYLTGICESIIYSTARRN